VNGGLVGGTIGAVTGGILGGISAVKDGRKFWNGDKVESIILVDQDIPTVGQIGDMNCGPAAGEAVDKSFGGSLTQNDIRNLPTIKWHPDYDPTADLFLWDEYCGATGHLYDKEIPGITSPSNILSKMQNGSRAVLNLNMENYEIGHTVVMSSIVQETITSIRGNVTQRLIYIVMDPSMGGNYLQISTEKIINAYKIFYIW
jgi:hypothetical protein